MMAKHVLLFHYESISGNGLRTQEMDPSLERSLDSESACKLSSGPATSFPLHEKIH